MASTGFNPNKFIKDSTDYKSHSIEKVEGEIVEAPKKKTNRKPRNPQGMPGICKHVYSAWAYLRNSGLTMD